jgi:hypothetical protein
MLFFHLPKYCLCVRPGTSAAIAPRFLPPCFCVASFSLLSSSAVHAPVRPVARSMLALFRRSTLDQHSNCGPILVTVRLHHILQLDVFTCCPFTCTSSRRSVDNVIQGMPSVTTLTSRSTRDQRGNCTKTLATVHFHCILQLDVFVFWPCTRASSHWVDVGIIQGILPSVITLFLRSTRNQRGNSIPIIATLRSYCILQHDEFVFCPWARTCSSRSICPVPLPSDTNIQYQF